MSADNIHSFQAEVAKLLHLMVHSVYSEREVFLRELISNAADALDKLRYEAVTDETLLADDSDLKITLETNPDAKTLTIRDNGIGMGEQELIDNLGTIARSGTKAFIEQLSATKPEGDAPQLIGQFGVGFYSAFMVADHVDVVSRRAGEDTAWLWQSDGAQGFSLDKAPEDAAQEVIRGTRITLHLKEDAREFLDAMRIEQIVRTYSDHISFPIMLKTPARPEDEDQEDKQEDQTDRTETSTEDKDGDTGAKPATEERQLNDASALWTRPKSEITQDQYKEFYHHNAASFDDPALTIHYQAEGRHSFTALLFLPTMRPFDLYDPNRKGRIKLYVRRVFITDDADLLPSYLRFVRGVIDSEDMPLNISREMLQNNPIVGAIRKAVTNRVLNEIKKLAEKDAETFEKLWEDFGPVLKEGLYEDTERRDTLYDIARFHTSSGESWRTLKDYLTDMHENQTAVYYLTGENLEQLKASPQLEGYRARDIEVLLLADPVDSFWVTSALGFEGKPFKSITQGEADLSNIPVKDGDGEAAATDGEEDRRCADRGVDRQIETGAWRSGQRCASVRAPCRQPGVPGGTGRSAGPGA